MTFQDWIKANWYYLLFPAILLIVIVQAVKRNAAIKRRNRSRMARVRKYRKKKRK